MKKKKGNVKPQPNMSELQAKIFEAVMSGQIDVDYYANPELSKQVEAFKERTRIEVPAFTATLAELSSCRDVLSGEIPNLDRALDRAVEVGKDKQKLLEYHEGEMLRHSKAFDAITADIKQVSDAVA